MLSFQQISELVGMASRPVSLTAVAQVFGISVPFSFRQVWAAAQSGNVPRPFYVVGHNPNTIADVHTALDSGANAIEPDVNVYDDHEDQLCISHEEGDADAPSLSQFLMDLHDVAVNRPELALVVFDCKPKVATAEHGASLLQAIRTLLTFDIGLNIIVSIAHVSEGGIFDSIKRILEPREGLMVDEDDDPDAVSAFFAAIDHQCYGNGVANVFQSPSLSPHLRPSIERACVLRAKRGKVKFVYTWSVGDPDRMREDIRIGVNGIIAGDHPSAFDSASVATLSGIIDEGEFQTKVRLAGRSENPFRRPDTAYGLEIHTGGELNAGTDANVTFTLTGTLGSSSKTIDASLLGSVLGKTPGRMERNAWDFVTLQSLNLGDLESITVQRDDQGNAPDWFLDRILVNSFRYGASKQANFQRWIGTSPVTQPLV
jgi:glycerophosphoryl diester phosphodiesterase